MKKIKITEAQAEAIHKKLSKKKLKITSTQLEMIKESLTEISGADAVTSNFRKATQQSPGLKGMKVEQAGLIKEYGSVELLEMARSIIEFILRELNNPSQNGLDTIWIEMGITKGEMLTALADTGLWGYTFFKLSYSDKVRAIGRGMKSLLRELMSKKRGMGEAGIQTDETQPHYKPEQLIGMLDLPNTRAEVDWDSNIQYLIPSLENGDSTSIVRDKEFFTGRQFETKIGKKIVEDGFVKEFAKKFGEMPIFQLNGDKINIVNPEFLNWQRQYTLSKGVTLNKSGSAESTGSASSGAFVGAFGGSPSDDYNDELAPSNQMADSEEGIITDAVTDKEELKGLEVGTEQDYYIVDGIEDKIVTAEGNIIFIIRLKDGTGAISPSHLLFRYNISNNKMSLMYAIDETSHVSTYKAFPEVYHQNLDTISNILAKMASQTDESTSYGGGTSSGAYDTPGFAKGKDGKDLGGGTTQNFDVFGHDGSKVNGGTMKDKIVGESTMHEAIKGALEEVSNLDDTAYPEGGFVDIDDCAKLNNNRESQNGGCSQGDGGVVSIKKTKNSVISNQKGE